VHLEEFAEGSSLLHRLDPRIKILIAGSFSLVVALADRYLVLLAGLGGALVLIALAGLGFSRVAGRLAMVNIFVLFLWAFLPFSHPGQVLFRLGPLAATREGILYTLAITLKSNTIVLAIIALLATSTIFTLIHALRHLKVPDKLVHLLFFTFRYFQVIHQEYLRLRAAMRIRCFHPRTNMHTYRSLAYLVGMLLVRSFDRSERIYQAMLCRGYRGRLWILGHFHLHRRDVLFSGIMAVYVAALAVGQWSTLLP